MVRHASLLSSFDRLSQGELVALEAAPATEVLAHYRDAYDALLRTRRTRVFASGESLNSAGRERMASERRVLGLAEAAQRRARAVGVDLRAAREQGPAAVLAAIELAIERHTERGHGAAPAELTAEATPGDAGHRWRDRGRWKWLIAAAAAILAALTAVFVRGS